MKAFQYPLTAPKQSHIEIVRFLSENINRKFTQIQIAKGIGKGKSYKNVRESIKELVKYGVIDTEGIGPYILCSLDIDEPATIVYVAFAEHSKKYAIYKRAADIREICERLINQIKQHTPFFAMLLFGSYAKGIFHEKSDIDLIILIEKKYHDNVKREVSSLQSIYAKKINAFAMAKNDYESMLASKEEINIGKESLKSHVLLYSAEIYYQIVRDVYGKGQAQGS